MLLVILRALGVSKSGRAVNDDDLLDTLLCCTYNVRIKNRGGIPCTSPIDATSHRRAMVPPPLPQQTCSPLPLCPSQVHRFPRAPHDPQLHAPSAAITRNPLHP